MNNKISPFMLLVSCLILISASACGGATQPLDPTPDAPATTAPVGVAAQPAVPTSTAGQQGVPPPASLPDKREDQATDTDSSTTAAKKMAAPGSDTFVNDLFERPFNAPAMDQYFPYLDIVDLQGYIDATWGYATITLSGPDANGQLPDKYGVELDLNKDGRGDWLILVTKPVSTDWSTQGVQAWKDTDGDVGGTTPITSDKASSGDGYETLVFDQGKSSGNPDDAWARISSTDNKTIELAFKLSMIGNPKSYTMGAWAGADLNPAMFDFNDHFTHILAGDPDSNVQFYPIKVLFEIDNTCRIAVGFQPNGNEPGLCLTFIKQKIKPGPPSGPPPPPVTNPNGGRGN